jgi:hypothetical protein
LVRDSIAIIILPLLAIGSEQLEKISRLPLAKPVFINAENAKEDILNGQYTHILVSPEILVGKVPMCPAKPFFFGTVSNGY